MNRLFEHDLAEVSYREQVPLLAYSPLAMGTLSGKYLADPAAKGRLTVFNNFGDRYKRPLVVEAVTAYDALAKRHGMSLMDLSLSYLAQQFFMGSIIIGATSVAQCAQQLAAYEKPISKELLKDLEQVALRFSHPCA
jgi:aryl-alcohol dehydrogenase-like predicted oxidoreductase